MYKKILTLTLFASTLIYASSLEAQPVLSSAPRLKGHDSVRVVLPIHPQAKALGFAGRANQQDAQTTTLAAVDNEKNDNLAYLKQASAAAALGIGAIMTARRLTTGTKPLPFEPGLFTHTGGKIVREACEYTHVEKEYCEDYSTINDDTDHKIYGVYDGHGGSAVAAYASCHIGDKILTKLADGNSIENALTQSYLDIDAELPQHLGDACKWQGSTALTAVVTQNLCTVANTGDSRAVLVSGNTARQLSTDHKPNILEECARIMRAGGTIRPLPGRTEERVDRDLAMSRALGDHRFIYKNGQRSVIADPTIQKHVRSAKDLCVILATDGLWDFVSNKRAALVVQNALADGLTTKQAAERLGTLAIDRGSRDDVTVVIVPLRDFLDRKNIKRIAENKHKNRLPLLTKVSLLALTVAGARYVIPELRNLLTPRLVAV